MSDELDEFERLERNVRQRGRDSNERRAALAELGHRRTRFGYATAGLRDMLLACGATGVDENMHEGKAFRVALGKALETEQVVRSNDPAVLAGMGEALRVYARDVQLSRAMDDLLQPTIVASARCFEKAIGLLREPFASETVSQRRQRNRQLAWLYAHRAAARMMTYWLDLVSRPDAGGDDALFDECRDEFDQAIELMVPEQYTWAVQFKAFLYALRGQSGDFETAQDQLGCLGDQVDEPTIQRSIAMLNSYTAADPTNPDDKRLSAARAGQVAAMRAQRADQDEFLGPYSGAACRWVAYDIQRATKSEEEQAAMRAGVLTAIETADIRARNAISQALVALLGLTALKAKLAADANDEPGFAAAMGKVDWLAHFIEASEFRDIESRAMVLRDPVWKALQNDEKCQGARNFDYDALRAFKKPSSTDSQRAL